MLSSALVAAMSLHAPACQDFPAADPALLVPSAASVVLGLDLDAFAKTSIGKAALPALRSDLQLAESLEILDDCGLELERSYALTVARAPDGATMVVAQARGIGTQATLQCLEAELRARKEGADPWRARRGSCYPELAFSDSARAWLINDYTAVWASGSFVDSVAARFEGGEPMQLPSSLSEEFGRLDRSKHLWLAAELSDADRSALPGAWASMAQSLTASIDLSQGMRAVLSLSGADVASTVTMRELVLLSFTELAERLDSFGVAHRIRERAAVGIVDGVVAAALELDERELLAIRRQIGEQIRGRGPL